MFIPSVFQFLTFISLLEGTRLTSCFHCLSSDASLDPPVRRHIATQTDVFFWPIGTKSNSCSEEVDPKNPTVDGQICSKFPLCVTLVPNIGNSTFVVRGCFENILRHNLREDQRIHNEGCYMVRSLPLYPNNNSMDYIICVCRQNYCNGIKSPDFIPGPYTFPRDAILKLSSQEDFVYAPGKRIQLKVTNSSIRHSVVSFLMISYIMSVLILYTT